MARPPSRSICLVGKRRVMTKCGKTGSPRPTINCTAMTARMSPGTVEPTGVVASSPRDSMIMPNECRCKRSEEHTSELQSRQYLVCRLLLEKKKNESNCKILIIDNENNYKKKL